MAVYKELITEENLCGHNLQGIDVTDDIIAIFGFPKPEPEVSLWDPAGQAKGTMRTYKDLKDGTHLRDDGVVCRIDDSEGYERFVPLTIPA